ncbi:SDR family oxidoreductase [Orrella sp. NBD-18]|uniref:SDR family oxidoreductase n=1 Tax=Sheuella amnicola TaxID=2707330 RepID=A0A6B2QXB9_9BURK|nr:SDR family oxidoreductase [Sheuella amnicola]NDY83100.1 SDR family oxidoreductase [Sheuella amnicola]HBI82193.1 NAD(P)-dependent oxidoreductase [Alcaligenaceae bacterium]
MKKIMLVTGAGRGIGAAIALRAAKEGYRVAVNYQNSKEAAEEVVRKIRSGGGEAVAIQGNVGNSEEVTRVFKELDEKLGTLDVLVNNAGILASYRVDQLDEENLIKTFEANVFSAFYCCREAVRRMSTAHGGRGGNIINMSSVAARLAAAVAGGSVYAASKGAIDVFNLALAKEVGLEGIRVNGIRPGLIDTEIHAPRGGLEKMHELAKTGVPMGRTGLPEEVAEAVIWLASDAASYVHGSVIEVAGGR